MVERQDQHNSLREQLLQIDNPKSEPHYKEYRMKLEMALDRAERNEKIAFHLCWISLIIAMILMFVGGTGVVGSFDPTDDRATPISIGLSIIYVLAAITWPLAAASFYSRFRPRVKQTQDEIRDAEILDLKREVSELRRKIEES